MTKFNHLRFEALPDLKNKIPERTSIYWVSGYGFLSLENPQDCPECGREIEEIQTHVIVGFFPSWMNILDYFDLVGEIDVIEENCTPQFSQRFPEPYWYRRDAAYENIVHYTKLARLSKNKLAKMAGLPQSILLQPPTDRTIQKLIDVTEIPKEIWITPYETEVDFAKACLAGVIDHLSPELIFATFDLLRTGKRKAKPNDPN